MPFITNRIIINAGMMKELIITEYQENFKFPLLYLSYNMVGHLIQASIFCGHGP
jgi:hypothetical protein